MVEIARAESAEAIAHGATGKGNDQVRFELTAAALAPELKVIAPWRDGKFRQRFPGRAEMIAFANENKIPVEASVSKPYSMDRNLLHISFESGMLEDPWFDASGEGMRDMYKLSVSPKDAPMNQNTWSFNLSRVIALSLQLEGRAPARPQRTASPSRPHFR